eukprot:m.119783 g.119783  ORF g.119783 m.119783 type:complete len:77 (-) comp13679_c2_seq6:4059-4289(-)
MISSQQTAATSCNKNIHKTHQNTQHDCETNSIGLYMFINAFQQTPGKMKRARMQHNRVTACDGNAFGDGPSAHEHG